MSTLKELVDETASIKNDISSCHGLIIEKLNNKGVSVNKTYKLRSLINKIDDITLESLGGKRWATGVATIETVWHYYNGSSNSTPKYVDIQLNLDFTPSILFCKIPGFKLYSLEPNSGYAYIGDITYSSESPITTSSGSITLSMVGGTMRLKAQANRDHQVQIYAGQIQWYALG